MGAAFSHLTLAGLNAKTSFLPEDKEFKYKVQVKAHTERINPFLMCCIATTSMKIF